MHVLDVVWAPGDLVVAGIGAGRFDKGQRLGRCFEGQLGGMVGVVQAKGEHTAFSRWQPLHGAFGEQAAVLQANGVVGFNGNRMNLILVADAGVFHVGLLIPPRWCWSDGQGR
ncbi:hypothetical protein D3C78_1492830 [compost metagenome]